MQTERHRRRQRKRQTTDGNGHVRRLQSQLQSTVERLVALDRTEIVWAVVEQVVGASGSQAVEPEQPAAKRLKPAGPLTRFLCGLLGDTAKLDEATKRQLWIDAFKTDWQGDLALLPDANLTADNGLLLAHSRSMYHRLCKRFPQHTEMECAKEDPYHNYYNVSFNYPYWSEHRLLLIPMRHGWFDLFDFSYPIILARLAIRHGLVHLLKHLDRTYDALRGWMAIHDPTSEYWHKAVDLAAENGHLDVIQYLFSLGVTECTTWAMDMAATNGHLYAVKWLHKHRTEGCTTWAMDTAAENGHLSVIKWLHENRTEGCTAEAMENAARSGHLHVVKWLHETRGEELTSEAVNAAFSWGNVDVVKYMHSKGRHAPRDAVETAAIDGDTKMLRCLLDCGYGVELGAFDWAETAEIADILLGSLTLDQAQALFAEAKQGEGNKTTIERLESTIKNLQASSK